MNHIVCFYWQGDRWKETDGGVLPSDISYLNHLNRVGNVPRELAVKYINNLYIGVSRWTTEPFKFVCFTNENLPLMDGIEQRSINMITKKGVMPRMYMFSKEAGLFGNQVLSLDIDLIITGSLDDLLRYEGLFCTRKSWTRGEETLIDGDVMSFKACPYNQDVFWDPILCDPARAEAISEGRERFWVRHVMEDRGVDTWNEKAPDQVVSYKHHVRRTGRVPYNARIISCHGFPRPHQIEDKWRAEYWK